MKRRSFLKSLTAFAAAPLVPAKALFAAPSTAAAATLEQPYLWASFITRVHNKASPDMLVRLLKLEPAVAQDVFQKMLSDQVISPPDAFGISRAVNPFPQFTLSSAPPATAPQAKLSTAEPGHDSSSVNRHALTSEDACESDPDTPPQSCAEPDTEHGTKVDSELGSQAAETFENKGEEPISDT